MDFATMINKVYVHMGNPVIAVDTVWDVYLVERVTLYVVDNTRILGNAIVVKHSL